ncbi:RHS repeat-associated protein [Bacillus oleivorans]|uniref:RHS repeat-associated protein n=1 Tax=Bacillus oleivorans TaxID=1448271 RepID=A0A285CMS1_9BACI|nr:RHS repeat-associated protein [Bacillus oleivorans]
MGGITSYQYNTQGLVSTIQDANGQTTSFGYSLRGQLTSETNALGYQTTYQYDAAGQMTQVNQPNGMTVAYNYNPIGLVSSIESNGERYEFGYDALGQMTTMTAPFSTDQYTYDGAGQLIRQYNVNLDKAIDYVYDPAGNLVQLTNSEDRTTTYTYDERNLITSVQDPDENITTFAYDALGREVERGLANGNRITNSYDKDGNLLNITNHGNSDILSSFTYEYDVAGNRVKQIEEDGAVSTYTYDALNRLTEVTYPKEKILGLKNEPDTPPEGSTEGNVDSKEDTTTEEAEEPKEDQPVAASNIEVSVYPVTAANNENNGNGNGNGNGKGNGQQPFADCTANESSTGNIKGKGPNNGNGPFNNPGQGNKFVLYKKWGENPELKEQMDVTETVYLYQGFSTNIHKEYSVSGSPYAEYYMGANNQLVSRKMFGYHGLSNPSHDPNLKATGGMLYYQYDGLNTVSAVTDRHGDIIENYRYDVFGGITTGITAPYNVNAYTSQRYDDKAGLIDMNARWYDPTVGRFLTQDTYRGDMMNPLTLNRYSYVLNNPVNMWDPTGHYPESIADDGMTKGDSYHIPGIPDWVANKVRFHSEQTNVTPSSYTQKYWQYQGYNRVYLDKSFEIKQHESYEYLIISYEANVSDTWFYNYSEAIFEILEEGALFPRYTVENEPVEFKRQGTINWSHEIWAEELAGKIQALLAGKYQPPHDANFTRQSTWAKGFYKVIFLDEAVTI